MRIFCELIPCYITLRAKRSLSEMDIDVRHLFLPKRAVAVPCVYILNEVSGVGVLCQNGTGADLDSKSLGGVALVLLVTKGMTLIT